MLCAYCNKAITEINYKTYKKKIYHNKCYQLKLSELETENRQKAINFTKIRNNTNDEEESLNQLKEYICNLFHLEQLSFLIEKQIIEYTTKYKYTYNGICKTLQYFYDLCNNPIPSQHISIAIVPYVYEEAKAFYYNTYRVNVVNEKKHISTNNRKIKIQPPDTSIGSCVDISKL